MNLKRKIMVVTGTRADYGLLKHTIAEIHANPKLSLCLVVTGSHLSSKLGMTVSEIEADGFPIAHRLPILDEAIKNEAITSITAKTLDGMGKITKLENPDILVVLGDRYESFAATVAASLSNIPVAHIHGGELTLGAVDDALRHSMTKMAWWHFTAAEEYRCRVIRLGEDPEHVFNVGTTALDALSTVLADKEEIEKFLGRSLVSPIAVVTLHPQTRSPGKAREHAECMLQAIEQAKLGTVIFTKANADQEGAIINECLEEYVKGKNNALLVSSLGHQRYLGLVKLADVAIGNSSSLVIEAPILGTPAVNIGTRQDGRVRSSAIIDVPFNVEKITQALSTALVPGFKADLSKKGHPFGQAGVAKKIVNILASSQIPQDLSKRFYE
ncbi:MAG: UDP-N-acetylglucosamine 2-epimerase [Bacteriovoracia bacterium]